jgi:hypothetical protein
VLLVLSWLLICLINCSYVIVPRACHELGLRRRMVCQHQHCIHKNKHHRLIPPQHSLVRLTPSAQNLSLCILSIFPVPLILRNHHSWTIVYNTIYACQDRDDDVAAEVKSTAVLFGSHMRPPNPRRLCARLPHPPRVHGNAEQAADRRLPCCVRRLSGAFCVAVCDVGGGKT